MEKDLEVRWTKMLDIIQQCVLAALKANRILSCTFGAVASRVREVIFPLYSALLKPLMEIWSIMSRPGALSTRKMWSRFREGPQR